MIAVIDYGMGNLKSVSKAFDKLKADAKVTSNAEDIKKASKVVFPGVGSFEDGMEELNKRNLTVVLKDIISKGKPFLGLCLGLQLLFERSEEAPNAEGLGILKGKVKRFPLNINHKKLKVPHVGWNQIRFAQSTSKSKLLTGIEDGSFVYFVHSYYTLPEDEKIVTSTTEYGITFCSTIKKDNIYATQFHPEKSQKMGLKILENFARI
jgi:glutamine amidotransferase